MTLIQRGWSFDELIDFTAVRLASLHTVVNPWLYPLTRRKYRDAFWYLLTLFAYYVTCTLVARPGTTLGEYQPRSHALFAMPLPSSRETRARDPGKEASRVCVSIRKSAYQQFLFLSQTSICAYCQTCLVLLVISYNPVSKRGPHYSL